MGKHGAAASGSCLEAIRLRLPLSGTGKETRAVSTKAAENSGDGCEMRRWKGPQCPQQDNCNGVACGEFAVKFADAIGRGLEVIQQKDGYSGHINLQETFGIDLLQLKDGCDCYTTVENTCQK